MFDRLPNRWKIWPEVVLGLVIFVLFYVVSWFVIKPSFSIIDKQVHYLNSEQYFHIVKDYLVLENISVQEDVPMEITLGELKSNGYIGDDEETYEYFTVFSKAENVYSDDSRIIIVKKNNRYQYSIRLCPHTESTCDRNSDTILDTTK